MRLLFLRHGQTATNVQAAVHRKGDEATLDETGQGQAVALVSVCRKEGVQAICCSSESRAQETADIIGEALSLQPIVLQDLHERDWGDWSGKQWSEIQASLQSMALGERYEFIPPNGESWRQMEERLRRALWTVTSMKLDCVAVVSHGGALRALMPILKEQPKETSFHYDFGNASVTIFELVDGNWHEIAENDTAHLR